jgi:hypothetical protein
MCDCIRIIWNTFLSLNQVLRLTNLTYETANNKVSDQLPSVSFVSLSKTHRPIASCASIKQATHVSSFDAQIHYSQNCFFNARHMKMSADAYLLREIHIITITTWRADMRLAQTVRDQKCQFKTERCVRHQLTAATTSSLFSEHYLVYLLLVNGKR